MPTILEQCKKFFGTKDLYKLFEIEKNALEKDVKKAYYKKSLQVHPDRVKDEEKEEATEKFKVLSKLYNVLMDKEKRALYDEQGIVEEDDEGGKLSDWLNLFEKLFKPISVQDINNFEKEYIGSEMERNDIKKAYIQGKGCINHLMDTVPFFNVENEPRMAVIIDEMVKSGEVPEFEAFKNEPASKRKNRHRKYAREAKTAKQEMQQNETSLVEQMRERQISRANHFADIMAKYSNMADEDSDDIVDFEDLKPKRKKPRKETNGKSKTEKVTKKGTRSSTRK